MTFADGLLWCPVTCPRPPRQSPDGLEKSIARSLQEPGLAIDTLLGLARGFYYRLKFKLLGRKVIIGKFFRARGPLDIHGPGTVIFGDNCTVLSTRLRPTTPYTHAPDAVIHFGNRVLLTHTRLGCQSRIEVGDGAGLAECAVFDTDFHSVQADSEGPRYNTGGRSKPILIGPNVWVGQAAMVLKGSASGQTPSWERAPS